MPETLKFEADQRFERGLDQVDVVVHGRHSHEQQPHSHLRQRLIVTTRTAALAPDPSNAKAMFWNPAGASFDEALAALGPADRRVGIVGGTAVFGLFLDLYDVFYLTRAPGVRLPGGRPVFPGVPDQTPRRFSPVMAWLPVAGACSIARRGWRSKPPRRRLPDRRAGAERVSRCDERSSPPARPARRLRP